ncbi:MAG: helix-turn-helix domain-containing protein [Lachnospiraceae bacterium]|nr:helix-turn-helix domain-containing protein [Lachnospiraceae bacterium]
MIKRPEYDLCVVGKNLKRLREAKNLSVDQVREYLCLGSVQAVYKYEKGRSYPQADTMFALMELYDASLNDIVRNYEEDEMSSSFHFILNYWFNDKRKCA